MNHAKEEDWLCGDITFNNLANSHTAQWQGVYDCLNGKQPATQDAQPITITTGQRLPVTPPNSPEGLMYVRCNLQQRWVSIHDYFDYIPPDLLADVRACLDVS